AYRDAELGRFIIHRVIGTDLDRYIFKGDNNAWTDTYEPTRQELVGKLWFVLPGAGQTVRWLRNPLIMAVIAGLVGVVLMTFVIGDQKRNGKKKMKKTHDNAQTKGIGAWLKGLFPWAERRLGTEKNRQDGSSEAIVLSAGTEGRPRDRQPGGNFRTQAEAFEMLFFVLGFLFLAFLILGIFAFTHPLLQKVPNDLTYQQKGVYTYTATAPGGVYDTPAVLTGQPIFPKLTCLLNLRFDYSLAGNQFQDVQGTHQFVATISEPRTGWTRILPLESVTSFTGNAFTAQTTLDLCQVESLVATMEKITTINPGVFNLVIDPNIEISGKIAGQALSATFQPALPMQFDAVQVYLYRSDPSQDPLNQSQDGLVKSTKMIPNTLPIFGWKPEVGKMRTLAAGGLGISLALLLAMGLTVWAAIRQDQHAVIQVKYAPMLVDIQDAPLDPATPVVEILSIDDLARIAERENAMILHTLDGVLHAYYVQGDRMAYRYGLKTGAVDQYSQAGEGLEASLSKGLERGEFRVFYQPIVSLTDGKVHAVEALLRWQRPQQGLVTASEFIFLAEKTGLIEALGEWMLKVACAQLKEWQAAGLDVKLAVNLSERQLASNPARALSRMLQASGIAPQALQIEVPEASLASDESPVLPNLLKLSKLGVTIAVDNFAGQASVDSLIEHAVKSIKIDRDSMKKIRNPSDADRVGDLIAQAQLQGLNVVAEGVETKDQLGFLREKQCTYAQGYFFGRPAPADEITDLLTSGDLEKKLD
ncbi:MAG TPA: DUF5305 family protein, partial [Anaerolineales bacterium]|nr:DUF5305 family protein [Anaerolineales bacterium]